MKPLFPFQEAGISWLSDKKYALLADEMGLGKSVQSIKAADDIAAPRILVICAAVAKTNWLREFQKWSRWERDFVVRDGMFKFPEPGKSFICSHAAAEALGRTPERWKGRFDVMIIDEAHFLKNPEADRTQAIMAKTSIYGHPGVATFADRIWALTGTPMPNHAGELWVLLRAFGQTNLPYDTFTRRYCELLPGYKGRERVAGTNRDPEAVSSLRALLKPIMLRRTVEEVMPDLPKIITSELVVEPGEVNFTAEEVEEATAQEEWLSKLILGEDGRIKPEKMKMLEALSNSVSTLRRYNGLQKIEPVANLISEELEAGAYKKLVVFGCHTGTLKGMMEKLRKYHPVLLVGETPDKWRNISIDMFQKDPRCQIIFCNIEVAGTSITLTAASQVLVVEAAWSPGKNAQALARARRIGSQHTVFARFVCIRDSVDEKVTRANIRKAEDIALVLQ